MVIDRQSSGGDDGIIFKILGSTICIRFDLGLVCLRIGVCVVGLEPHGFWVAVRFAFLEVTLAISRLFHGFELALPALSCLRLFPIYAPLPRVFPERSFR